MTLFLVAVALPVIVVLAILLFDRSIPWLGRNLAVIFLSLAIAEAALLFYGLMGGAERMNRFLPNGVLAFVFFMGWLSTRRKTQGG